MHYSEDASTTKFLVVAMWILDTLHTSLSKSLSPPSQYAAKDWIITNYDVPTGLEYIVVPGIACDEFAYDRCSSTASDYFLWADPHNPITSSFFAYKIYYLCRPQVKWLVTAPIILFVLAHFGFGIEAEIAVLTFTNNEFSSLPTIKVVLLTENLLYQLTGHYFQFYALIPCATVIVLAEVLITLSLCILLYDSGSHSVFPRTKHLLNILIIYVVNRCLLTLLVALAELITLIDNQDAWAMGVDFNIGKLYANSLLASLNTRQYLRAQVSGPGPDRAINDVHFDSPKLSGNEETPKNGKRHLDDHRAAKEW
ncbi:hypothetical protein EDD15DRAFT_2361003 [Pisolithus albus]|nr:hypothetical protein EDD15DRAFT_2361003 [Pisolithus albus]